MKILCSLLVGTVLLLQCNGLAAEQWAAVLSPQNSLELGFVKNDLPVFKLGLGGWGPKWAWVGLSSKDKASGEKFVTTVPFVVNKANGEVIDIKLECWKSSARQLTVKYELSASRDVPVTMVIAGLGVDKKFARGKAVLSQADGQESTVSLPFPRGARPETAKATLALEGGDKIDITFDPPCALSFDGDMRIMLASEVFKQGTRTVTLTVDLPSEVEFVAKPEDLERYTKSVIGPDWFPFTPGQDASPTVISMNDWLEQPAGKRGGVRMVGDGFQFEDGTPVKFWGVNLSYGGGCAPEKKSAEFTAARYAKYGVNGVRLHKFTYPKNHSGIGEVNDATKMSADGMDRLDYFSAQMKERGIYFGWSHSFGFYVCPGNRGAPAGV